MPKQFRKAGELPPCAHCGQPARKTTGEEIYPLRQDLAGLVMYKCDPCQAYVGAHKANGAALGRPANAELRKARLALHNRMFDPLWQNAPETGGYTPEDKAARKRIQGAARSRCYAFLSVRMNLAPEHTHIAEFDIEQCREAWRLLKGVTYPQIRDWSKAHKRATEKGAAA